MRNATRMFSLLTLLAALPAAVDAQTAAQTSAGPMTITAMASGLDEPWGFAFLPGGDYLITERDGRLLLFSKGAAQAVTGLPDVYSQGQGGLLDVLLPRDFATSREVWLTYSARLGRGAATAVGKGQLSADGTTLEGFSTLYTGDATGGGRHFGSRMVEAPDGTIWITTGDRGTGPGGLEAQDPARAEGKVIHLNRDGSPATIREGWRPGVFSRGHRNAQGATLGPDGALWLVEHGAQGGDEVNRVEEGRNYGWPVISYGVNYGGAKLGEGTAKDGMEQPLHYWDPSIAPSGMTFYSGRLVPQWKGDIFFGSLNSGFLGRLDPDTQAPTGFAEERIETNETARVRDVREGPDGAIWFLSVVEGTLYRMAP